MLQSLTSLSFTISIVIVSLIDNVVIKEIETPVKIIYSVQCSHTRDRNTG